MATPRIERRLIEKTGLVKPESLERSVAAVLATLRDRLTPEEARHVAAQLPTELKEMWQAGETAGRSPETLHRDEFFERVRGRAGLRFRTEARRLTLAVFAALKEHLSPGEAEDVVAQLPKDLKAVWNEA